MALAATLPMWRYTASAFNGERISMSDTDDSADAPPNRGWTEDDSLLFVDLADVFVPSRDEQIATIASLVPAAEDETFTVVELAAGGGALAVAVLQTFPNCHYVALDGSAVMRTHLREVLRDYGERVEVHDFELADTSWRHALPTPLRCVISSLSVHHLDGAGKQHLFADLAARIMPGGALLLADIVEPLGPQARHVFASQWDVAAQVQSLARDGDLTAFEMFRQLDWNYFTAPPDPMDKPSRLFDQLLWLREAGFSQVDCFWMRAGHAIYGGYK
jgi:SAM-dependent methyltransferase